MSSRAAALMVALATLAGCEKKTPLAGAGEACLDRGCAGDLLCNGICMTTEEMARARAATEEAARRRELRMLEASGVAPGSNAEAPEAAPGAAIRVVKVTERGKVFAACRSSERLVGGGCLGGGDHGPEGYTADDTVGARWSCETNSWTGDVPNPTTAYALCARVPSVSETQPAKVPTEAGR